MGIGLEGVAVILSLYFAICLLLLCVSVRLVAGCWPSVWRSVLALFATMLVAPLILAPFGAMPRLPSWFLALASLAIHLSILAGAVRWLVRRPDGTLLAWGRSLGASALCIVLFVAVGATTTLLLFGSVPGLSR